MKGEEKGQLLEKGRSLTVLNEKIKSLLLRKFDSNAGVSVFPGFRDNIHVFVISALFDNTPDYLRLRKMSDIIDSNLEDHELVKVSLILCFASDEREEYEYALREVRTPDNTLAMVCSWTFTTTQIEIAPMLLRELTVPMRVYDNCPMNCGNEIVYLSYAVLLGPYDITRLTHAARCWRGKKPNLRKIAKKLRRNVTLQKRAREVGLSLADYRERMRGSAKWNRSRFYLYNPNGTEMKLNSHIFPPHRAYFIIGSVEK